MPEINSSQGSSRNNGSSEIIKELKHNMARLFHEWAFMQIKNIREEGLALLQLFTLRYLYYRKPGDLSTVAEFMGVSKPAITGAMDTLERDGYVRRMHDTDDRRRIDIELTDRSLEILERFESRTWSIMDDFFESMPVQCQNALNELAIGIIEKLGKDSPGLKER